MENFTISVTKDEFAALEQGQLEIILEKDYQVLKKHLLIRPLNYATHKEYLNGAFYEKVGDIALVLYLNLGEKDGMLATTKVKSSMYFQWYNAPVGSQVMADAMANTSRLYPATVVSRKHHGESVDFMKENITWNDMTTFGLTMLSAAGSPNGAAALFYPGVQEKLLKLAGEPFYAVFMNTIDIMLFKNINAKAAACLKLASSDNDFGEYLSDRFYICDRNGVRDVIGNP